MMHKLGPALLDVEIHAACGVLAGGYLTGKVAQAATCDALTVPVVTGRAGP